MLIYRTDLAGAAETTGPAVVIDVLRAFTTTGYLFSAGVERIILVAGVDEAFALRDRLPGSLILGEIDGIQVAGFDLGNGPSRLPLAGLAGKTIIQRTTTGTQGVVKAVKADPIYAAALTNARATVQALQRLHRPTVTLIQTGLFPNEGWGDEDAACADLIESMLRGNSLDALDIAARVRASRSGGYYDGSREDFPPADLDLALRFDCFDFAMQVKKENGLHVMKAVRP